MAPKVATSGQKLPPEGLGGLPDVRTENFVMDPGGWDAGVDGLAADLLHEGERAAQVQRGISRELHLAQDLKPAFVPACGSSSHSSSSAPSRRATSALIWSRSAQLCRVLSACSTSNSRSEPDSARDRRMEAVGVQSMPAEARTTGPSARFR